MIEGFSNRCPDGIRIFGVDHGGPGKILAENKEFIVIKWPAHKYWVGRGMDMQYASASTVVCKKSMKRPQLGDTSREYEYLDPVIEWSHARSKAED